MELLLKRKTFTEVSTIGELFVDGQFECFTLEDKVRDRKVFGLTAIPYGRYAVQITASLRFHRELPLLIAVPGFTGVRIHSGNTDKDTEGCILVGRDRGLNAIYQSRKALEPLLAKMYTAQHANEAIAITIVEERNGANSQLDKQAPVEAEAKPEAQA
jgi:hypothetical protein